MGLLNGLIGNASSVSIANVQKEIEPLLIESEIVENAFRLVRDLVIFTNKRLILSDIQGFTEKKLSINLSPTTLLQGFLPKLVVTLISMEK